MTSAERRSLIEDVHTLFFQGHSIAQIVWATDLSQGTVEDLLRLRFKTDPQN
jgi:hypothetical protein